jgi:hypothetical protein
MISFKQINYALAAAKTLHFKMMPMPFLFRYRR